MKLSFDKTLEVQFVPLCTRGKQYIISFDKTLEAQYVPEENNT